ncbi:hypothetical protein EBZ39_08245 [bacterium]|nr:hypothetical protein [bacterium]
MDEDDWDKLSLPEEPAAAEEVVLTEPSAEITDTADLVDVIAPQLLDALAELEAVKVRVKKLTEDVSRFAPEVAGEVSLMGKNFMVTVKRSERYEWDSEVLAALYGSADELPDYIKQKLTVDKKRFDRMSAEDREALRSALTIKLSTPSVEVRRNV